MRLYEIKEEFLRLAEMDLDEQTLADTLESLQGELDEKADNIACLIKQLEAEAEAIKNESKNLADRAIAKQNKADKLNEYLFTTFKTLNINKIETARNVIQVKKNPISVVLEEGFNNPCYMSTKIVTTPDKSLIKEYLQQGNELKGAKLEQKERLVLK
jgi:seryl-tRNA synthetase